MLRRIFNPDKCRCWVCKKTFPYFGTESPMLNDAVWSIVGHDEPTIRYTSKNTGDSWVGGGFLCKDCMEKRLGRSLKFEDLMRLPDGSQVYFNELFLKKYFSEHE